MKTVYVNTDTYGVTYGNAKNFCFSGINYFDSSTTYTGRQWGGWL